MRALDLSPVSIPQVQIFNPAFFKYVHDHWTRHHGRYPSTGMLVLFFALHVCDEVGLHREHARCVSTRQDACF